jgi:glucosamine--fructose-6-phosphate aminotransferase (isomerizing)
MAVLDEMRQKGAYVLSLGEEGTDVTFDSGLTELAWGPLYLPIGQLLAFEHSIMRGLDPDHPRGLSAVVKLPTL